MACRPRHFARRIEVFHADQPFAAVRARIGIGSDGGQQRADVEQPGRAGGKTSCVHIWYSPFI